MGSVDERVGAQFRCFIEQTRVFGATSASAAKGHVNVSPTGIDGTFAVLGDHTVAYVDITASGRGDNRASEGQRAFDSVGDRELLPAPMNRNGPDRLAEYRRRGNRHGIDGPLAFDDAPATPGGRSALDVQRRPNQVLLPQQEGRQQP